MDRHPLRGREDGPDRPPARERRPPLAGGGRSRPSETTGVYAHMLHADPPDHTRLRRLVQKPFASPRAALRPRAEEIAAGLLDEMAACGDNIIDLLGRYARPLPITVICELQDPSLLPAAVEELLRFTSPVNHANDRFTTQDVPIGGAVMPAGEWVIPAIAPADWDPARFPDPDRLDLGRDTSGNVAFGHGVHHCLGAPLARMEAEVALGALLARFPRISLAVSPSALRWRPVSLMNGLESLPVRLG
jgi:cytochrome P450